MRNLSRWALAPIVGETLEHRRRVDGLGAARDQRPGVRHLVVGRGLRRRFSRKLPGNAAAEAGYEVVAAMATAAAAPARRIGEFAQREEHRIGRVYHDDMLASYGATGKVPDVTRRWATRNPGTGHGGGRTPDLTWPRRYFAAIRTASASRLGR